LLDSWIEEIDKFDSRLKKDFGKVANVSRHIIRGALRYCKYHGQERPKDSSDLVQYDVVLTTYGTVVADFSRSRNVLERINWYRMIVDEGTAGSRAKALITNVYQLTLF
jgi:SWI/SNF-related matrix-associated actin-dependent regulator of chromatin subfamily A3